MFYIGMAVGLSLQDCQPYLRRGWPAESLGLAGCKWEQDGEISVPSGLVICTLQQILLGWPYTGGCNAQGKQAVCMPMASQGEEKTVKNLKGKYHLQRPSCRWEGSTNMDMGDGLTRVRKGCHGWLLTWCWTFGGLPHLASQEGLCSKQLRQ